MKNTQYFGILNIQINLLFRDSIHHLLVRLLRFLFASNNLAQDNTTTAAATIASLYPPFF
jgi:hypothetical protein